MDYEGARALVDFVDGIEKRFPSKMGRPTRYSETGEEYTEFCPYPRAEGGEGQLFPSLDEVIAAAQSGFDTYALGRRSGTLYWRIKPEIDESRKGWALYMRLLISDLPTKES